jgi:hypothetical protein
LAYEKFSIEDWLIDQQNSRAHSRLGWFNFVFIFYSLATVLFNFSSLLGLCDLENNNNWKYQQYLNRWRRSFEDLCDRWAFNWPEIVDIRDEILAEKILTCFMVIFIKCVDSVKKSYYWEKKFISLISTKRGQARLLTGQTAERVNNKLNIPPLEARRNFKKSVENNSNDAHSLQKVMVKTQFSLPKLSKKNIQ